MRPIPILTYHSISPVSTGELAPYTVHPTLFAAHLDALQAHRIQSWSVSAIGDALASGRALPDRVIGLTFDDAFADFAGDVAPLLARHGFGATLYIPTAHLGSVSSWLVKHPEDLRPLLTTDEVRALARDGVECGAHSHTHAELDRLPESALRSEILGPKAILEHIVERPVRTFAYPFGYHSRRVRQAVKRAGYASACATGHLPAWSEADIFALPRLLVLAHTSADDLLALLARPASHRRYLIERGKQAAWRLARGLLRTDGGRAAAMAAVGIGPDPPSSED
jgi:peptidoglycan/xylan/chitin deacetylase (PgdA/CDA1 family)